MNKIISFCLYGNKELYYIGLIENINIINEKYNDWKIYIYYNNIPEHFLNTIKSKGNTYLFECIHNGYNWEGMFWRFYPLEYNDIDIFLSRDADSIITDREMNLVKEWIKSNKSFHIIRDHEGHYIEILGGTFGINVKLFNNLIKNFKGIDFYKEKYYLLYNKNIDKQPDQIFLKEIIYPIIKNDNLTHISLESLRFSENDILILPSSNFIGKPLFT